MTKKDLTIVLIKVIGFYLVVCAIIALPHPFLAYGTKNLPGIFSDGTINYWEGFMYAKLAVIFLQIIGGTFLMRKSQLLAKWLLSIGNKDTDSEKIKS